MFLKRLISLILVLSFIKALLVYSQTSIPLDKYLDLKKFGTSDQERILKEIRKAFVNKEYKKVIEEFEKIGLFLRVNAEDMFLLSQAYLYTGNPEKAIDLAERTQSLKRGTSLYCEAGLLKVKALLILDKKPEAEKVLRELKGSFCVEEFKEKMNILESIAKNKIWEEDLSSKLLKEYLEELYEDRFNYLILKGKTKEAEKLAFEFINLTGDYRRGKDFFFKLAETYFKSGKIDEAKKYYQLIITEWDLTKEATISKFRLYQITYEKAKIKELLPPKTLEDLLMFITQIKTKYTEDKDLVEEASFLEIKVNFDRKNLERVRELSKEFIRGYSQSKYLSEVKKLYCEASVLIVSQYFLGGKVKTLREIAENEDEYLRESACGDFYYALGKEFFTYRIYGVSLDYFLTAYTYNLSKNNIPDLYLKLAYLADLYGETEIFKLLWEKVNQNLKEDLRSSPLFLYLKAKSIMDKNLKEALSIIKNLPYEKDFILLRKELYYKAYTKALEDKNYALAYEILRDSSFGNDPNGYILILSETLDRAPDFFEKILKEALEKFPQNREIRFLEVYYLTKKGDLKKSKEIMETLLKEKDYFSFYAKQQQKIQNLTQRVQEIVY
ncbi:MAG: tetratricopeptide repeat protein [Caldimicrobium sp.]